MGKAMQAIGHLVNDIHSRLNPTEVRDIEQVETVESIQDVIRHARNSGSAICVAGGRHSMGAQQYRQNATLIDTSRLNRVLSFDAQRGVVECEAGIQWPELISYLLTIQERESQQWGIVQKQTGADRLSLGGAIAANGHGRGLALRPIIQDVESFAIVDAAGQRRSCSRRENNDLFRLVIGGYGLFGIVYSVTLRLAPRRKLRRVVQVIDVETLIERFEERIDDGFLYGDFQFAINPDSGDFLRKGIFSCYEPVHPMTEVPEDRMALSEADWRNLVYLAHTDKEEAFRRYSQFYLATSGQVYWSDTHQLSVYVDDYHRWLDSRVQAAHPATEIITEVYVPRRELAAFMSEVRRGFRGGNVDLIYGTIRLIERDDESYLAWAKQPYACVIFNLHTTHTHEGIQRSAGAFRSLIDLAAVRGGSYYLTYHKYARRDQLERCYPQFREFLNLKACHDLDETFQSDWYVHHKRMFEEER